MNGFVVGATITDGGYGYTNTPAVRIIGGGGSGAQAVAVVSNGVVIAVNVLDAGSGYTNTPVIVIEPPFIAQPTMGIAAMSLLSFTNLALGTNYQLQSILGRYLVQPGRSFHGHRSHLYAVSSQEWLQRMAIVWQPPRFPAQAFATAQLVNGFVVGATVTSGGSRLRHQSGSHHRWRWRQPMPRRLLNISGGVVTNITITDAGIGYTNTPTVEIAPPPAAAVSPTVLPVMRVDSANLAPYDNYQIQFKPDLGGAWGNWNGGLFSPTDVTNSQYLFITNDVGFFRLEYVP